MAEIGRWCNHKFEVSPFIIRSFTDLQIKGSSETEEKTREGYENKTGKYISWKNGKPIEVSFAIHLHASLGCDVQSEAAAFVNDAHAGSYDYFYLGNKKMFSCQFMLTDATISKVEIAPGGEWASAVVQVTMKQCSYKRVIRHTGIIKNSNKSGGYPAAAGSQKQIVTPTKPPKGQVVAYGALTTTTKDAVTTEVSAIRSFTTAAKKVTAAKATTPKAGTGGGKVMTVLGRGG